MHKLQSFKRSSLSKAICLAMPLLAVSASANTASRNLSSSRRSRHNAVVHVADKQQATPARNSAASRSAFSRFGGHGKSPQKAQHRVDSKALTFLQQHGLLDASTDQSASLSGELIGRKQFATDSPFAHCHSSWGGTYYTNTYTSTNSARCVNTYGGTWHEGVTSPVVMSTNVTNKTSTSFDVNFTMSETSTVYAVLVDSSKPTPSSAQVLAGTDGNGTAAIQTKTVASVTSGTLSFTGLTAGASYMVYIAGQDTSMEVSSSPAQVNPAYETGLISDVGTWKFPKVKVDGSGNFYVAHSANGTIKFLKWNGSGFSDYASFSAADISGRAYTGWGNQNRVDYELDSSGNIHVVFSAGETNMAVTYDPFYGYYNGSTWTFTNIAETGNSVDEVDLFLDANDKAFTSFKYYNGSGYQVNYATNVSGSWVMSNVVIAGSGTDEVHDTYVVADSSGTATVFYRREDNQNNAQDNYYRASSSDSFATKTKILDGVNDAKIYRFGNVIIDSSDKIHYAYSNQTDGLSYYVTNASGSWVSTGITSSAHSVVNTRDIQQVGSTFYFASSSGTTYFLTSYDGSTWTDGFDFELNGYMNDRFAISSVADRAMVVSEDSSAWEIHYHTSTVSGYVTAASALDSDANLIASSTVTEPVGLDTTADSDLEAVDVFDFTLSDGGGGDNASLDVTQIVLNVSGTSTDTERGNIIWRLSGPDASNVTGSYSSVADTITFSGLNVSIAEGESETYTVNAYYNTNSNITEDHTIILSVDGDTDLILAAGSTSMGTTSAITNGTGTTLDVVATALAFTTQPSGSVSGSALSTQPVVTARDAFGNTDVDFTETVTLSQASAGSLGGDVDVSAVSGVATFTDVTYTATADQQSFTLTANDEDGSGSNLSTTDANAVTADVVATTLVFATEPAPTTINSAQATAFSTVPVVQAVDGNGTVDTGYSTDMVLSVTDPNDSTLDGVVNSLTGTGDSDGSGTTVTLTPGSGTATFSNLNLTYTVGGISDSIALNATSGGLAAANSSTITANGLPTVTDAYISISGASGSGGTFKIGDTVTVTWNNTGSGDNNSGVSSVSADFSAFGGGAAVTASNSSDTWTATYTITSGAIDSTNLNVSVTATNSGGSTTTADTSNASVDNIAPSVTDGNISISGGNGSGGAFIVGDTVTATWNDTAGGNNNSDTISTVTVDFSQFGGGSAVAASNSSDTWTATYAITPGSLQASNLNVSFTATDNAGNTTTTADTSNASVDNQAPSGHSVAFGDSLFNASEASAGNFSFAGAEVGASYNYSISSSGGGSNVTGSGTLSSATQSVSGINLGGLGDGTLTLNVLVTDAAGNISAAVGDSSSLDATAPALNSSTPADEAGNVQYDADLVLQLSENVIAGSGSINLYNSGDDSLLESISVAAASISGDTVTINPAVNFTPTQSYYVQIGSGALTDTAGNPYSGINDNSSLNFNVVNNAPTGVADSATTNEDNAVAIDVLANDSDSDGSLNPASVTVVGAPANGSTSVNTGTGVVTYTPTADYEGNDSFTYTVDDLYNGTSAATTVSITINAVNDNPVAVADVVTTDEDTPINIDVAANDTDVDNGDSADNSTISLLTQPANGSASVNAGVVVYTPDTNYNGSDSFTYTIDDQNGATSNTATVMINVTGVNDAPVAANDSANSDEDNAVSVDLVNNDSDVDGTVDATTVTIMGQPANGTVAVNSSTGAATYTPDADFNGSDSFTYVVQDDAGATSNLATVSLTINSVNDAPVAADDTVSLQEDTAYNINALGNDSDVDGTLSASSLELVSTPGNGTASVSNGVITYTPGADFNGSDSLTYRVQDNLGEWSNTATVSITVQAVNDEPLANNDSATTDEDTAVVIDVLTNDSDLDGTLDATTLQIVSAPASGNVNDNGDGTLTYTPAADSNGTDSFIYTVQDDLGGTSNSATVSISVRAINDAPQISGSPSTTLLEGQAYSFTPAITDVDNNSFTVSGSNLPAWISLNTGTGEISGTPVVGDAGVYSNILLTVSDGSLTADLVAFDITVLGDNDTDGTQDSIDTDDDNDGMSDEYEVAYGFNPLDDSDAAEDRDGDTLSNLQESLDNTDPDDAADYYDVTAPIVSAPADLVIDAVGLFTPVPLHQLLGLPNTTTDTDQDAALDSLVYDNVDGAGCCGTRVVNLSNRSLLLAPGRNTVTYQAEDRKGNVGSDTQIVDVRPLVSVNKDQVSVEGASVQFRVILNGRSPQYPLTVPYLIDSSSTADSADHNLVDGTVVFQAGETEASINIQLTDDMVAEGNEVLVIRLDDMTSNAEDLANGYDPINPDIYDINSGAKNRHRITIAETNVAPDVVLQLTQNGSNTILVTNDDGLVTLSATITDPNPGDTHSLDWSGSDNQLQDLDGVADDNTLVFDPATLPAGLYRARVLVSDDSDATDTATLYFSLVATLPTLGSDDSDGDGVDDQSEGTADSDDDGILDYLDNISSSNVLPEQSDQTDSYLLECDPGVRCRLGQHALLGSSGGARVDSSDLQTQGVADDSAFAFSGGIFDFEVHDLPTLGQSVSIVIPQVTAIPAGGIYRKLLNGRWRTFVEDANNALHSAPGNPGYCPPPGDASWESGLVPGYYCVQLTIEDGGPNDADGLANASIEDPGGVALQVLDDDDIEQTFTDIRSTGSGSGGSGGAAGVNLLLMLAALAWGRRRQCSRYLSLTLAATLGWGVLSWGLLASPNAHADWTQMQERLQDRGYVALALFQARGSQSAGDFRSGMAANDVDVTLQRYDEDRTAHQFTLGYRYRAQLAVELGYLDLGDVDVNLSATGTSNNLQAGLDDHYPASGKGWTLANRFIWPLQDKLELSAEAGLFFWDGEINLSGADVRPDLDGGTDWLLGVGAHYKVVPNLTLGGSIRRVKLDDQHVDLLGLEARFHFQ